MSKHRLPIIATLLLVGALTLAGSELALAPASAQAVQVKAVAGQRAQTAPRTVKKAKKLVRQSAAQLASNYKKGRAKAVCTDLTAKGRKLLGGNASCIRRIRLVIKAKHLSKMTITKFAFRGDRTRVTVSGNLTGKRKHPVVVTFRWERGRYRLDPSLSTLFKLFA